MTLIQCGIKLTRHWWGNTFPKKSMLFKNSCGKDYTCHINKNTKSIYVKICRFWLLAGVGHNRTKCFSPSLRGRSETGGEADVFRSCFWCRFMKPSGSYGWAVMSWSRDLIRSRAAAEDTQVSRVTSWVPNEAWLALIGWLSFKHGQWGFPHVSRSSLYFDVSFRFGP